MALDKTYEIEEQVNVLTRIPGRTENDDDTADSIAEYDNSAVPWPFDDWFHGDFTEGWKTNLGDARSTKFLDEYADPFPNFRMDTAIEIGIDTDGDTVTASDVSMTDPGDSNNNLGSLSEITLEGEYEEPHNPFRNEYDHYDGSDQRIDPTIEGRYVDENHNFSAGPGVEGVRASLILGTSDQYLNKVQKDNWSLGDFINGDVPLWIVKYMSQVPAFYSFIDFALMADGTRVVKVWDASVYPAHALYVGGTYKDENLFRKGIEWVETGWWHEAFKKFAHESHLPNGRTPFDSGGHFLYSSNFGLTGFKSGFGDHPVMFDTDTGSTLLGTESEFQEPFYPVFQDTMK